MAYIKLEDLRKFPFRLNSNDFNLGAEAVIEYAENLPIADVEEVRHGYWREETEYYDDEYSDCNMRKVFACSVCGRTEKYKQPYCNCGAKMNGGKF